MCAVNLVMVFFPTNLIRRFGRFAQPETRAAASAARGAGETNHFSHLAVDMIADSNWTSMVTALKTFFKNNPGWE
jgi:hypothetical protein